MCPWTREGWIQDFILATPMDQTIWNTSPMKMLKNLYKLRNYWKEACLGIGKLARKFQEISVGQNGEELRNNKNNDVAIVALWWIICNILMNKFKSKTSCNLNILTNSEVFFNRTPSSRVSWYLNMSCGNDFFFKN